MYKHLESFTTSEGHWSDFNILKPIVGHIYSKYRVESILEVGFNIGYSASLWLETDPDSKSRVTSVDIGVHKDTIAASKAVKGLYKDRFRFILSDSKQMENIVKHDIFDLAFIDGDHTQPGVIKDIQTCLNLKIPYLLFDDWHPQDHKDVCWSNGVKISCDEFENAGKISKVEIFNLRREQDKLALYRNDTIHTEKNLLSRQLQLLSPSSNSD
jgi:hypothetical protein